MLFRSPHREWLPFTVTKSVELVGDIPGLSEFGTLATTLLIDAPGKTVLVERLVLGGDYGAMEGDAVEVRSARFVQFRTCTLRGGTHVEHGVDVYDAGLRVTGQVDIVSLIDCSANGFGTRTLGGNVTIDEGGTWMAPPVGGPGLVLPPDLVGLANLSACSVTGGMGAWINYQCDPALDLDPPGPMVGGDGGPGLVGECYASGSSIAGGEGGGLFGDDDWDGCIDDVACAGVICDGVGDAGVDVEGSVVDRELSPPLLVAPWGATGQLSGRVQAPGLLVLAFVVADVSPPLLLRKIDGPLEVLPPWISITAVSDPLSYFRITADVPDDPLLLGRPVFAQVLSNSALSMVGAALIVEE